MSWVQIPHGKMADALNHLHSEVVYNAVTSIAQRPDLTTSELDELLNLIEQEVFFLRRYEREGVDEA